MAISLPQLEKYSFPIPVHSTKHTAGSTSSADNSPLKYASFSKFVVPPPKKFRKAPPPSTTFSADAFDSFTDKLARQFTDYYKFMKKHDLRRTVLARQREARIASSTQHPPIASETCVSTPDFYADISFTSEDAEVKEFSHIPITHLPNLFESSTPILEDSKEEVAPMIPGSTYNHNIPITYIPDLFNTKDSTSKGLKASNTALDYDTAIMPDAFSDIASLSEGYETAASSLDELPPTFQLFTFPISFNRFYYSLTHSSIDFS
ncbi:unnamed protein product [Rhizophagus irregularis]|uniref:Uncharacterized protein n=1 Tax=Rhizophagus irregularis TaxID=588596 RepID=A0A915Z295_9GLOM|nr:unnamed protein product [Rhizophagus irregularis]CAB5358309.1 unnamed protein product [Rhizophagus irregularis]